MFYELKMAVEVTANTSAEAEAAIDQLLDRWQEVPTDDLGVRWDDVTLRETE